MTTLRIIIIIIINSNSALYILCFGWHIIHIYLFYNRIRIRFFFAVVVAFLMPLLLMLMFHIDLCHSIVILTLPLLIRSSKRRHKQMNTLLNVYHTHSELFTQNIEDGFRCFLLVTVYDHTVFFNPHENVGSDLDILCVWMCEWDEENEKS